MGHKRWDSSEESVNFAQFFSIFIPSLSFTALQFFQTVQSRCSIWFLQCSNVKSNNNNNNKRNDCMKTVYLSGFLFRHFTKQTETILNLGSSSQSASFLCAFNSHKYIIYINMYICFLIWSIDSKEIEDRAFLRLCSKTMPRATKINTKSRKRKRKIQLKANVKRRGRQRNTYTWLIATMVEYFLNHHNQALNFYWK